MFYKISVLLLLLLLLLQPLCQLACRAATKVLHFCLFWASLWMVPQVWLKVFNSPSTVRRQVFLGLPLLRLPSGVQCRAIRTMLSGSLLSTCPIHFHLLRNMMVSILSWWHSASSSSFDMVFGQNILSILRKLLV